VSKCICSQSHLHLGTTHGKFRLIQAAPSTAAETRVISVGGSPVKTYTLAQAQQLGILPASANLNTSSKIKQVIVKGNPSASHTGQNLQQQIIRIPTSMQSGSIQSIQVGNKLQYVRVIGANDVGVIKFKVKCTEMTFGFIVFERPVTSS
jgi:hypothetical protein